MQIRKQGIIMMVVAVITGFPGVALAIISDQAEGKWSLNGQFKTQATVRTEDEPSNTPIPYEKGNMTSQRNLLMLEWKHDLGEPFFGIKTEYNIKGRAYYDGAWDYGPKQMSDDEYRQRYVLNNRALVDDREEIDKHKWKAEIFNAYIDMSKGPLFTRIGRQVLSWGEMSTIRILDGCNPMDTSSLAVDMQERLIPLWMVRANLAFDSVGPFESVSLGGYYVPGKIDNTYEETMIDGSPIIPPIGRDTEAELAQPFSMSTIKQFIQQTDSKIDKDRFGVKLGVMYKGVDLNLAYYRMYSERPVPQLQEQYIQPMVVNPLNINIHNPMSTVLGSQFLVVEKTRDTVDVFGGSLNKNIDAINTVLRAEAAYFMDVPMQSPGTLMDVVDALEPHVTITNLNQTLDQLLGIFPLGPIATQTFPYVVGKIPKYDLIKYGIGLDKWINIPFLSKNDFLFTFEYVGTKIQDYQKKAIINPWYEPWDKDKDANWDPTYVSEYNNTFILVSRGNYLNGNLNPQCVAMYEVEPKALVLIPSVSYSYNKFNFNLSYFMTEAKDAEDLGMLDKYDELSFSITYSF